MVTFTESGMKFGPFNEQSVFLLEKNEVYSGMKTQPKIAECLLAKRKNGVSTVWIVEAKSSSPQNVGQDEFVSEIHEKMLNSLLLYLGLRLGRHGEMINSLPSELSSTDLSRIEFKFILVLNGHQESWLAPLKDKLHRVFLHKHKAFRLSSNYVSVINDERARAIGLIS